jgi:hypothetical protein
MGLQMPSMIHHHFQFADQSALLYNSSMNKPYKHAKIPDDAAASIVVRYRAGETAKSIAVSLPCDISTVARVLKKAGEPRRPVYAVARRYTVNDHAFKELTAEALYWVGFIMADGCIVREQRHGKIGNPRLVIRLQGRDHHHLESLRSFLKSSHPVTWHTRNGFSYASLAVTSATIAADLATYGVTPAKSASATACPAASRSPDFWRGVIDGDGSICLLRTGTKILSLTGSRALLNQFRRFAQRLCPGLKAAVRASKGNGWQWHTSGDMAGVIVRHLYNGRAPALERKAATASLLFGG